jgi:hypothetical protein
MRQGWSFNLQPGCNDCRDGESGWRRIHSCKSLPPAEALWRSSGRPWILLQAVGALRDSLVLLAVVLEQQTELKPTQIMTDTGCLKRCRIRVVPPIRLLLQPPPSRHRRNTLLAHRPNGGSPVTGPPLSSDRNQLPRRNQPPRRNRAICRVRFSRSTSGSESRL